MVWLSEECRNGFYPNIGSHCSSDTVLKTAFDQCLSSAEGTLDLFCLVGNDKLDRAQYPRAAGPTVCVCERERETGLQHTSVGTGCCEVDHGWTTKKQHQSLFKDTEAFRKIQVTHTHTQTHMHTHTSTYIFKRNQCLWH